METDRETDRQTDRPTGRQTDTQTSGQADGRTDGRTDKQTDRRAPLYIEANLISVNGSPPKIRNTQRIFFIIVLSLYYLSNSILLCVAK